MRVVVVGAGGMLGHDVVAALREAGHDPIPLTRRELDLEAPVVALPPHDAAINCAAYTAVDRAESDPELAHRVNGQAPGELARLTDRLIHVSTDFVFDGEKGDAYVESDAPAPLSVYGDSKLAGERAVLETNPHHLVVRTSWLFGERGKCFPRTMLTLDAAGKPLHVVADQFGTPTATRPLARALVSLLDGPSGVLHVAGPEIMTWADLAEKTIGAPVARIATSEYPTPARRPRSSALISERDAPILPPIDPELSRLRNIWLTQKGP